MEIKNTAIGNSAGANWIRANVMAPGSSNYATNVRSITLAPDKGGNFVRMIYESGSSGVLALPNADAAQQAVQAWLTLTGQVGASVPTDPVSASISNLTGAATQSAVANKATDIATATGMPVWLLIGGLVVFSLWLLPKIWRFVKTKIFRRR